MKIILESSEEVKIPEFKVGDFFIVAKADTDNMAKGDIYFFSSDHLACLQNPENSYNFLDDEDDDDGGTTIDFIKEKLETGTFKKVEDNIKIIL